MYQKKPEVNDIFSSFPSFDLGNGFILRKPRVDKEEALNHWYCYNDPKVQPFVPDDCVPTDIEMSLSDLLYVFDLFEKKISFFWTIAELDTDKFVGNIGFHEWSSYHKRAEISYELNSKYWKRGIMISAIKTVLEFAFKEWGLKRVQATTILENRASDRLLLKAGFIKEGLLHSYKFYRGNYTDIAMYGYSSKKYFDDLQFKLEYRNIISMFNSKLKKSAQHSSLKASLKDEYDFLSQQNVVSFNKGVNN